MTTIRTATTILNTGRAEISSLRLVTSLLTKTSDPYTKISDIATSVAERAVLRD